MAAHYNFVPAPPDTLPKDGWQFAAQTLTLLKSAYHDAHASTERFNERMELAEQYRIFDRLPTPEQPYGSLDAMLQAEIGATELEAIALKDIQQRTQDTSKTIKPELNNGGNRRSKEFQYNNVILKQGNSAKYLAARIARDRPDILEEMKAGKYRSVRAAAIDAGIVKVPTSLESAEKAFLKLSKDERETFLIWVSEQ